MTERTYTQAGKVTIRTPDGQTRTQGPYSRSQQHAVQSGKANTKRNSPGVHACKFCCKSGLVWYYTLTGRWMLAEPLPGSLSPNPKAVHICKRKLTQLSRSYKASTYRLGKSPGSYR